MRTQSTNNTRPHEAVGDLLTSSRPTVPPVMWLESWLVTASFNGVVEGGNQ